MCMRDRPALATRQTSILLSVVVGIPRQIYVVITTHSHPRTTNIPAARSGAWISATICANM